MPHGAKGEARRPLGSTRGALDPATEARARLYDAQAAPLYRTIYQQVGNRAAAEALTTQVFQYAEHYLDVTQGEAAQTAWLFGLARNAVADYWKAYTTPRAGLPTSKRTFASAGVQPTPPMEGMRAPRLGREQLARLPEHDRQVLTLRLLSGYSLEETARALGCTTDDVKIRQYQALQAAQRLSI